MMLEGNPSRSDKVEKNRESAYNCLEKMSRPKSVPTIAKKGL
jgi:hypothetical protein